MRLTMTQRQALTKKIALHYQRATKKQKRGILDEFIAGTDYHRTYAAYLLGNHRRRLFVPAGQLAQDFPQIMSHGFKATRIDPSLSLLMHRMPGRQVIGNQSPGATRPNHVAHRIEKTAQSILSLGSLLFHQSQIGSAKLPLLVGDIAGIAGFSTTGLECFFRHPKRNAWL